MFTARGVWGHAPLETFLEFKGYEIAYETIFGTIWCYSEARWQFHMYEYLPFPPIALYSGSTLLALRGRPPSNDTKQDTRVRKKVVWLKPDWPDQQLQPYKINIDVCYFNEQEIEH